ncbi:MAG: hypothetical protein F6K19_44495 [Cyanothece sp. SIO1E1]|nr:hypothetical protein [Cyanothece sp. SIO1E1]
MISDSPRDHPVRWRRWRRQTEPLGRWMVPLAGSISIHVLCLVVFRPFLAESLRVESPPDAGAPTPIELVEISAAATSNPTPSAPANTTAPSASPFPPASTAVAAAASTLPEASGLEGRSPTSSAIEQPQPNPENPPPRENQPHPPAPSSESAPEVPSPRVPSPRVGEDITPTPSPVVTRPSPAPPPLPLPPLPDSSIDQETRPDPSLPAPETDAVPPDAGNPDATQKFPAQIIATLVRVASVDNGRDLTDKPAQPQNTYQSFTSDQFISTCLPNPDSISALGSSVALRIVVGPTNPSAIELGPERIVVDTPPPQIERSSGNQAYDQLAICLLKDWKFLSASNNEDGVEAPLSELIVDVQLN